MVADVVGDIGFTDISAAILGVGALGTAAFGVVDALGKATASSRWELDKETGLGRPKRRLATLYTRFRGLPYVGFAAVQSSIALVAPALQAALGEDYHQIVREQYRDGRGAGLAPTSMRQAVRLGLTLLSRTAATKVIHAVWGMEAKDAARLAAAIARAGNAPSSESDREEIGDDEADRLMGLFLTAWDTRVESAFAVAEQRYQAAARGWAAITALGLSCGLNAFTAPSLGELSGAALSWPVAFFIGVVAVPLAPVAKDLASSLSQAVDAFKAIRGAR